VKRKPLVCVSVRSDLISSHWKRTPKRLRPKSTSRRWTPDKIYHKLNSIPRWSCFQSETYRIRRNHISPGLCLTSLKNILVCLMGLDWRTVHWLLYSRLLAALNFSIVRSGWIGGCLVGHTKNLFARPGKWLKIGAFSF
jgi:hypothetical protein